MEVEKVPQQSKTHDKETISEAFFLLTEQRRKARKSKTFAYHPPWIFSAVQSVHQPLPYVPPFLLGEMKAAESCPSRC